MIKAREPGTSGPASTGGFRPWFDIRQRQDEDGALRVTLLGELDIAVTDALRTQLDQLRRQRPRVRLDLSQLEFIDCGGVRGILDALADARRDRWALEVDELVSSRVRRVTTLDGVAAALWPPSAAGR